ncbi:ATP-binding protein [Rhodococcus sp. ZPP]|nr:ATP-binding protein [Rhodococcus sp. ZPP]
MLLAGPAGVGKSRLAGEVLDELAREGVQTVRISATTASSNIPLGVFAPILPTTAWAGKSGAVNDRADLLSRCATTLVEQYQPARLVLLVDDIHLVDDMSATLLYQLADTDRVTILATYRTKETSPNMSWDSGKRTRRPPRCGRAGYRPHPRDDQTRARRPGRRCHHGLPGRQGARQHAVPA